MTDFKAEAAQIRLFGVVGGDAEPAGLLRRSGIGEQSVFTLFGRASDMGSRM